MGNFDPPAGATGNLPIMRLCRHPRPIHVSVDQSTWQPKGTQSDAELSQMMVDVFVHQNGRLLRFQRTKDGMWVPEQQAGPGDISKRCRGRDILRLL
jgi:hypothetical protein